MASRSIRHSASVQMWNRSGLVRGAGIPPPSGSHRVGCMDLMRQFEGDTLGLLVRLFYPTDAEPGGAYQYSNWLSHKRYIKGILDYSKVPAAGLLTTITSKLFGEDFVESSAAGEK